MSTCLVTGGAGFLGSHLCDELIARGNRVICVDNLETGSLANIEHIQDPGFTFLHLDIIEPYYVDEPIDVIAGGEYLRVAELVSTLEEASFS